MCTCPDSGTPEEHVLVFNPVSGRLECVAHPQLPLAHDREGT